MSDAPHRFPPVDTLVPHSPPMSLLDEVVRASGSGSACRVTIRESSMFLEDRGVPAFVTLEYMAQAVAVHAGLRALRTGGEVQKGFLLGTPRIVFQRPFLPVGSSYLVEVAEEWGGGELRSFTCHVRDEASGEPIAQAGVRVYQPDEPDGLIDERNEGSP